LREKCDETGEKYMEKERKKGSSVDTTLTVLPTSSPISYANREKDGYHGKTPAYFG
jgi:hypothetical protein